MNSFLLIIILGVLLLGFFYVIHFVYRVIRGERIKEGKVQANNQSSQGIWLFAAVLAVAGYWGAQFFEKDPDFKLTAKQLYNEFNENELAAFAKYQDKLVEVSGKHVGSGVSLGRPWVLLDTESKLFTVQCFFPPGRAEEASKTKEGQKVLLKGIVSGQTGNVFLDECAVAD